ncbi:Valyl-tRNA synthetase [Taphrina deformans PYCC 5710]|uniref:Valine--tRNA ligase, mitochondrial n=1 Tax=Taphrina deformans (strain PYCC 5710 / ATCC 11124 / CBS 356.35 / IMI 108563 / JCM 9778 / NBRC 8474) TaxID=1097556 RepID=R4X8I8_TAPDE|nr:Valyl-tRNA synthetase [Taphrina deformans PYCC 5710]|eukprot:CCG81929.1 Valyl-tRNA synthetase [Taphrina deformans PYCC 5710]
MSASAVSDNTAPVDDIPEGHIRDATTKEIRPMTEKEVKKAAEKKAKDEKFKAKQKAKEEAAAKAASAPKKEKKAKAAPVDTTYTETTPAGEKKRLQDIDSPALKSYNPAAVESAWYAWWEKEGLFEPEFGPDGNAKPAGTFSCPAPPPNVTGALHIGHALTIAIQDSLSRWHRMKGKTVLFLPGFDHAGLSTQSAVEKKLWQKERKTRHDFSRPDFIKTVWDWKEEYHTRIKSQFKRLGASFDWSREAFTMDENLTAAVVETFCRLHEEGIIYRANRLVNWCTKLTTTLSNLEVDQKELPGRTLLNVPGYDKPVEFGAITSFAYQIEGSDEKIIVATTRPETMLGDTGIAVHPEDPRYKHLHGKYATHPLLDRRIPIVLDDVLVDMAFGTGAVKVTPAHDPNDYECGKRHKLDFINILNDDGTFNENCGEWNGVKRFDARVTVVDKLRELGLFIGIEDNPMSVPLCSKSGDVIEPLLKPQWWVKQSAMAEAAKNAVLNGEIEITPKVSENDFIRWMDNVQDWCISRQLWWGHQAPVYFVKLEGDDEEEASRREDNEYWISGRTKQDAEQSAKEKFAGKNFTLVQDEDVLDTWFSSGLWPWSTVGWPKETLDMKNFYPTSLLETGWDILFFWVARMVMLGIKLTGKVPFKQVYCHSLIRDAQGRKMSKTLGNVVDPIDVIQGIALPELHKQLHMGNLAEAEVKRAEANQKLSYPSGIPECGTDALRFALCAYTTGARDINLDIVRIEGYRKFCNKIYNATKFALMRFDKSFEPRPTGKPNGHETLVEKWMLHKFSAQSKAANDALEKKDFLGATTAIYSFWLYDLCDVFIENSKHLFSSGTPEQVRSCQDTLYTVLDGALKLISPFMPFLTEELWQRLPRRPTESAISICKASYPEFEQSFDDQSAADEYEIINEIVKSTRSLMSTAQVKADGHVLVKTDAQHEKLIKAEKDSIVSLVKGLESLTLTSDISSTSESAQICNDIITVQLKK